MTFSELFNRLRDMGIEDDMIVGSIYISPESYESDLKITVDREYHAFFVR
jgi:hypothetical protein